MGEGREEPSGRKGACAATVSVLGGREGSWELKELAAGGFVSSVCEQFVFEIYAPKKKFPSISRKRTLRVRNAQVRPEPSIFHKQCTLGLICPKLQERLVRLIPWTPNLSAKYVSCEVKYNGSSVATFDLGAHIYYHLLVYIKKLIAP